jgi:hypothetical protein
MLLLLYLASSLNLVIRIVIHSAAVVSNEELYDRMRQQRMLREELREKKKELEDMMRKEHPVKQNTRNQDTQSDVVSFSNKSDQFGYDKK